MVSSLANFHTDNSDMFRKALDNVMMLKY